MSVCPHADVIFFLYGFSRPSEQSELKLVCSQFERSELSGDIDVRSWCVQEAPGETCKTDAGIGGSLPAAQRETGMEPHGAPVGASVGAPGGTRVSLGKHPV